MQLPAQIGGGELDFGDWMQGLIAAFIGGGAGAFSAGLSVIIVDPHDFNIYTAKFWQVILSTFVLGGLVPFFAYLHNKPLPDKKLVVQTVQETSISKDPPVKTVMTRVETHTEDMPKSSGTGDGKLPEPKE